VSPGAWVVLDLVLCLLFMADGGLLLLPCRRGPLRGSRALEGRGAGVLGLLRGGRVPGEDSSVRGGGCSSNRLDFSFGCILIGLRVAGDNTKKEGIMRAQTSVCVRRPWFIDDRPIGVAPNRNLGNATASHSIVRRYSGLNRRALQRHRDEGHHERESA
jgi:hypothetical protein